MSGCFELEQEGVHLGFRLGRDWLECLFPSGANFIVFSIQDEQHPPLEAVEPVLQRALDTRGAMVPGWRQTVRIADGFVLLG